MFLCKIVFILFLLTSGRNCKEPRCSKYDFEEKVLEKMVRMEFQMEQMKSEVEQCVNRVESIKVKVSDQMTTNQQELEKGFNVRMKEVSNSIAIAKAKLRELQDFKDTAVTPTIAFKARLHVDTAVTTFGQTIVFPTVIFNEGDAYNPNTRKFTAPVSGTYMFSLAFCVYSKKSLVVSIMIEETKYTTSMFYGDANHECLSADTVAIASAGQNIWVQVLPASSIGPSKILDQDVYRWNTFSGALINRR